MPSNEKERDLILNPRQYALILDQTKGHIVVYVGPHKVSVSDTDQPVEFTSETRKFEGCALHRAIKEFPTADERSYLVLHSPAKDKGKDHPTPATSLQASITEDLDEGRKVNITGPVSFPLWPGQYAEVIEGHQLQSNEYLIGRVYNADAAKENWTKAIVQPQTQTSPNPETSPESQEGQDQGEQPQPPQPPQQPQPQPQPQQQTETEIETERGDLFHINPEFLTMGQLLIIRGTDVSFYIPPTGIEILKDDSDQYVRNAVTLERLEYCILLDENGNKRYVRGPAVVFPNPTERFVSRRIGGKKTRIFRALELNEISGIYIKVIAPYDDNGKQYEEGQELFITGKDQAIYFPRPEHAILKYGDNEIHYAVAIPAGEARYVMNRLTGDIASLKGPKMFLPDPRTQVIVRRILDNKTVKLWFPGNEEAIEVNEQLSMIHEQKTSGILTEASYGRARARSLRSSGSEMGEHLYAASAIASAGPVDDFERKEEHTKPRTLVLDTKYEGAVSVNVWTGYAVLIVSKTGKRRVVKGPATIILDYDETMEVLILSSGKPKNMDRPILTAYLRVDNNKISDIIHAETKDLVNVNIKLSYRVNFEGDDFEKWFSVENYVKFLCDHLRSLIRNAVKKAGVEEFNDDAIDIIRDAILGKSGGESSQRPGRKFAENNMKVYDVEVLNLEIGDPTISSLLTSTQHDVVKSALEIRRKQRQLVVIKKQEEIERQIEEARQQTAIKLNELQVESAESKLKAAMSRIDLDKETSVSQIKAQLEEQDGLNSIQEAKLERLKQSADQETDIDRNNQAIRIELIEKETAATVDKMKAVEPGLISALQSFGDKTVMSDLMRGLGPHALLQGNGIADVLAQLVNGSPGIGNRLGSLLGKSADDGNGDGKAEKQLNNKKLS